MALAGNIAGDARIARSAAARPAGAHPRLLLTACILASSLAFVDGSVVNVGLPAIGRSLHANGEDRQWVINAYLLPLTSLLLLGGAAGDFLGKRRMLVIGVAPFGIGSGLCAAAPGIALLLASRVLQAAAAALVLAVAFVREDRPEPGTSALDATGALLAAVAIALLTWGLTVGTGASGWTGAALLAIAVGVFLLPVFVLKEKRLGDGAMMPLALFRSPEFVGLSSAAVPDTLLPLMST